MQINIDRFYKYLDGFKAYLEVMSEEPLIDLTTDKFFSTQEGYKHGVYHNAQNILDFANWDVSDIGSGKISKKAIQAVDEGANLVHHQQKLHFKNKVYEKPNEAEQLLYNIYCGHNDAKAFDDAVGFWGGKYDLLAYLFFIKDNTKYLPISSSNFDERFKLLGISLRTNRNCSSLNYFAFVGCISELRKQMEKYYGFYVSLLDAHSVIWQLNAANEFVARMEEKYADINLSQEVGKYLAQKGFKSNGYSGKPKEQVQPICTSGHNVYPRSRLVALNALYIAKNTCEINPEHESFIRKNSDVKYMEPHHLVPMAFSHKFKVSLDIEENIICLCSNCHNEIHYGKQAKELVEQLYFKRKDLLKSVGIDISLKELLEMY